MLSAPAPPEIQLGHQCFKPYACDFMKICWGNSTLENINAIILDDEDKRAVLLGKQILPA
jgi:hypothetical protein